MRGSRTTRQPRSTTSSLRAAAGRLRRGFARHRRLLASLCIAGAVLAGLQATAPPPPATVSVLTVVRDLPAGATLGDGDVRLVEFRPDSVPAHGVSRSQAVGRMIAAPMRRGEPVTDTRLVAPALLEGYPGRVAVPVRIPDADSVALLRVGDSVDLYVADGSSQADSAGGSSAVPADADLVVSETPVIALPPVSEAAATLPGRLIVIAATPLEVRHVASAASRGYLTLAISR